MEISSARCPILDKLLDEHLPDCAQCGEAYRSVRGPSIPSPGEIKFPCAMGGALISGHVTIASLSETGRLLGGGHCSAR